MPVLEAPPKSPPQKEPQAKTWTYTDYLTLDDDKRYEIIEGELLMSPAPTANHQDSSSSLFLKVGNFVAEHDLGKVFFSPFDVILSDDNVVQPDLLFIAKENMSIIQRHGIVGPPDLVVEIISPSSFKRDRHDKMTLYERFGVQEYWLIDPVWKAIEILTLQKDHYELHAMVVEKGEIESRLLAGFKIKVEDIISSLFDETPREDDSSHKND